MWLSPGLGTFMLFAIPVPDFRKLTFKVSVSMSANNDILPVPYKKNFRNLIIKSNKK